MRNSEIENELHGSLGPEEKLLWTGKPKTGIVFRNTDIFLVPFSILWAGIAVFWESTVLTMDDTPFPFALFGIPFVLIGLYITVGRFFVDAKKRSNTVYGITQDRIIIKSGIFSREIKSLNIRTLSDVSLSQKTDNSGTITLGPTDLRYSMMRGMEWPGVKQPPCLELIDDVKTVYDVIIGLQRQK